LKFDNDTTTFPLVGVDGVMVIFAVGTSLLIVSTTHNIDQVLPAQS
jgi:hypothetical protein